MLVGPSGAAAASSGRPAGRPAAAAAAASSASGNGTDGTADGPAAGTVTAAPSGRAKSDDGMLPPSSPYPSSLSEFEGHFQRLLLDRDGAATSSSNSPGGGRRRRLPPGSTAALSRKGGGEGAGSGSGGERPSTAAAVSDAEDVAAANSGEVAADVANHISRLHSPFLVVNGKLHTSGGALLAIYPNVPAKGAATMGGTAAQQQPPAGLRLDPASCDIMARLALGSSHLLHVVLWVRPAVCVEHVTKEGKRHGDKGRRR
ncbi:hypothetical protein Vafri_11263 [Volvox africanus]|nr:hypothetical protein Vafri_11263 [Volvox africanus]